MATGRYVNGSLMGMLIASSAAGVGLSFGRDVYRAGKKNFLVIVVALVALAGTAYGVWNMSRGHDRGWVGTFFVTFLMNSLLIVLSFTTYGFLVIGFFGSDTGQPSNTGILAAAILASQAAFALLGLTVGLIQRGNRMRGFAVAAANETFLLEKGFRDVGGREQVMIDADGNELVLDDTRQDAILFKIKGRRGVRARITLGSDGRMLDYVPA